MYGIETIKKLNDTAAKRQTFKGSDIDAGPPEYGRSAYELKHTKEKLRELQAQYAHDRAGDVFVR